MTRSLIAATAAVLVGAVLTSGAGSAQGPPPVAQSEIAPGAYQALPPVKLYPNGAPDFRDWPGALAGASEVTNRVGNDTKYYNVTDPSYFAYIPSTARNTRTAVIVAPGGGFRMLSWDSEGTLVAKWLAERGIAAFVLKYRLVQQAGPTYGSNARRDEPALTLDVAGAPALVDGTAAIRATAKAEQVDRLYSNDTHLLAARSSVHLKGIDPIASSIDR